jgi:hypothetical protein
MHFLLSALIEQGRQIELDVAVEALNRANEGADGSGNRILNRRLARGALLAARLLQEGVLEEDRVVREQFRKCLTPLLGSTVLDPLMPLLKVKQTSSLVWLLNVLFDHIKEADRSENIGAVILLSALLSDKDARAINVKQYLLSSPKDYIITIFTARMLNKRDVSPTHPMWIMEGGFSPANRTKMA